MIRRKPTKHDLILDKMIRIRIAFHWKGTFLLIKFKEFFFVSVRSFLHQTAIRKRSKPSDTNRRSWLIFCYSVMSSVWNADIKHRSNLDKCLSYSSQFGMSFFESHRHTYAKFRCHIRIINRLYFPENKQNGDMSFIQTSPFLH